jgi:hypothetical protein
MDMGTFERLAAHCADAELVFLRGWGERLLQPNLWEMARRAEARKKKAFMLSIPDQLPLTFSSD